jgi:hypothetical protein
VVASISIVAASFDSKIVLNASVSYDTIQIQAYNQAGVALNGPITLGKNKAMFTYDKIDTSKEVDDAVFTLTFTYSGKSYTASVHYSVKATYNTTVASMAIDAGSMNGSYYLGDSVDYSTIYVKLLNSDGYILSRVALSDSRLSHSEIDLTSAGQLGTFTFKVTYTEGSLVLNDQASYTVYAAEQKNAPTGWVASDVYNSYLTRKHEVSALKDGTTSSFMKDAPYRMGNYNAVVLGPKIKAVTSAGAPVDYARLYDTTVKLTDASGTELALSDYFASSDIEKLTTTGEVNFLDTVTGQFKLIYSYNGSTDKTKFPDITYDVTVVSGYNINTAEDLFVLNNATNANQENYLPLDLNPYREAQGYPKDSSGNYLTFDSGVFQADITIDKTNLPSAFLWTKAEGAIDDVVNTYKDGSYLVHFIPKLGHETLDVYGNYHKLTLSDDLPKIVTPVGDRGGQAKASSTSHVDSHAAIFSNLIWKGEQPSDTPSDGYNPNSGIHIHDLQAVGNQGITDLDLSTEGGPLFFKDVYGKNSIDNCVMGKFFLSAINGSNDFTFDTSTKALFSFAPTLEVNNCRISDTYSCSLFNYNIGTINVTNSELRHAGGPLIFNQGHDYTASDVTNGLTQDKWLPNNIVIDSDSILDNKVSGIGGWFSIYGVTGAMATLMNLNPLFQAKGKTFVTSDNGVKKMDLLALNMVKSASAGAADAAFYGSTQIGSEKIIDYREGKSALETGIANAATDSGASYKQALYSSDFGIMYMLNNGGTTPFFKTISAAGVSNYAGVYATDATNLSTYSLVNPKTLLTQEAADAPVASDFYKAGYLGIYTMGKALGGDPGNPSKYSQYLGSDAYGIVTSLSDYSA